MDKVSIIVPVYNVEKCLDRCIKSLISQTYTNIEIILVDDGSTDTSSNMCDEWMKKDKRIVVIHKKNGGLSSARNAGLKIATSNYIQFVDSDDWIETNCTESLYNNLKKYDSDISLCGIIVTDEQNKKRMKWFEQEKCFSREEAFNYLMENKIITSHAWNKLYKKEVLDGNEFPEGKVYEDIRVMHKIFLSAKKISITDKYLYNYYQRVNSITTNANMKNKLEYIEAFGVRYEFIKKYKPEYEEFSIYRIAVVMSLVLTQNHFLKKEIEENKEKLKKMHNFLNATKTKKVMKKYGKTKERIYFVLARIFSIHISKVYVILKKEYKYGNYK